MKVFRLLVLGSFILAAGAAVAAPKSKSASGKTVSVSESGSMKRSKSLSFDGRSVEAVRPGRFDSFTHLSEGEGGKSRAKLYDLPKDFSGRIADESAEMEYLQ